MEVGTQKEVFTRNKTRAGVEGHYHPCLPWAAWVPSQFSPPSGKKPWAAHTTPVARPDPPLLGSKQDPCPHPPPRVLLFSSKN